LTNKKSHSIFNVSPLLLDKLQLDKKHYLCDVVELDEDDGGEEEDGGGDEQEHVAQVQEPQQIITMIHQRNY
jgi:hypothetical protein